MIKNLKQKEHPWVFNTLDETGESPCAPIAEDGIIDPLNADMKNSAVPAKFWGTTIVSIRNGRLASGPDVVIINSC